MLLDSAFPTGGFVQSGGLEASYQCGILAGSEQDHTTHLAHYTLQSLQVAARTVLPFVRAAWSISMLSKKRADLLGGLSLLDERLDIHLSGMCLASEASRAQGAALLNTVIQAELCEDGSEVLHRWKRRIMVEKAAHGHLAVVFGCVLALICPAEHDIRTILRLFLFWHARTLVSAGVRLGMVGAIESQTLLQELSPAVEQLLCIDEQMIGAQAPTSCHSADDFLPLLDTIPTSTSPIVDVAVSAHSHLYSRLFTS